jgi:hypothetical protein
MGVNKSKLRRERKMAAKAQSEPPAPEQDRPMNPWVMRLIMMAPPVLYASYLVWDLSRQ